MVYYVQSNKMPEERAELRLVVKIGSVYEAENEVSLTFLPAPTRGIPLESSPRNFFVVPLPLPSLCHTPTTHPQTTPPEKPRLPLRMRMSPHARSAPQPDYAPNP
jgi:hypothetical protein